MTASNPEKSVLVIGGGLAGIAAAIRLAQRGCAVTLIETRKKLGGRATSFVDPTTGHVLDNCQHVLLKCCTQLIDLYERLGVGDHIEWHHKIYFARPDDPHIDVLSADPLPAPLHMSRALMQFKILSWSEKIAISRGMLRVMRLGKTGRERLADTSFADFLKTLKQPAGAIEKFWDPIVISACNELSSRVSVRYALQVFQDGFLNHNDAYVMGLSTAPLVRLYDAAETVLAKQGGIVRLGAAARSIEMETDEQGKPRAVGVVLSDGEKLTADHYVSAVPFDRLAKLCGEHRPIAGLDTIEVSPILGIHLWFAEHVMDLPHLVTTQSSLQWLFNKGYDAEFGGQHLHGVVSAAHDLVDQSAEQIIELVTREAQRFLPRAVNVEIKHARVVKEKRATFSVVPGIDACRPGPRGDVGNLYLAGDWCDTGWPATMEGAVRSGYQAASDLCEDLNMGPLVQAGDLQPTWLYRMIAGK